MLRAVGHQAPVWHSRLRCKCENATQGIMAALHTGQAAHASYRFAHKSLQGRRHVIRIWTEQLRLSDNSKLCKRRQRVTSVNQGVSRDCSYFELAAIFSCLLGTCQFMIWNDRLQTGRRWSRGAAELHCFLAQLFVRRRERKMYTRVSRTAQTSTLLLQCHASGNLSFVMHNESFDATAGHIQVGQEEQHNSNLSSTKVLVPSTRASIPQTGGLMLCSYNRRAWQAAGMFCWCTPTHSGLDSLGSKPGRTDMTPTNVPVMEQRLRMGTVEMARANSSLKKVRRA